jgi:hypothetical protein
MGGEVEMMRLRANSKLNISGTFAGHGLLQRKCACGGTPGPTGECEECRKKRPQRKARDSELGSRKDSSVPSIVHEVLRSPGQPLDPATRAFMEPRFGHDFSNVRVHTDTEAAESAQAMNALAYTVGNQIAFGTRRYAPGSLEGRKLLAHELTHTVQQIRAGAHAASLSEPSAEQQAERNSSEVAAGSMARVEGRIRPGAMQKADDNALDAKAKKIIEAAKDTSKSIEQRSIDAVNSILKTYYDPALVETVVYKEKLEDEDDSKFQGLVTSPIGSGKDIKGRITVVSKYFIENIDSFARRVLQVGHELQHVQQQRDGKGGPAKKNEREFLAFHWEATQPEKAGTGKMPHASRVALIDEALRNYHCMPEPDQKTHTDKKDELLKLRETEEKASGREHTEPPKSCEKKAAAAKDDAREKPNQKSIVTQPPPQKLPAPQSNKKMEFSAKAGVETETKREESRTTTEAAGKFSFEVTIPITEKLQFGPVSFFKEAGAEASAGRKFGEAGPLTSLELEATAKVIALDFEKVKVPLGVADFGLSGSVLAGAGYNVVESKGAVKLGVAAEAEAKFKRNEQSPFFITVKGGVEKTYGKEGNAEFKWSPLTWKTSAAVGVEF